jgi:hypothetical protein
LGFGGEDEHLRLGIVDGASAVVLVQKVSSGAAAAERPFQIGALLAARAELLDTFVDVNARRVLADGSPVATMTEAFRPRARRVRQTALRTPAVFDLAHVGASVAQMRVFVGRISAFRSSVAHTLSFDALEVVGAQE